jgi:hypothetical protein
MEQITQRYPDDYEGWIFYALTLQASAPKADLTYANQIKSAAILDKMYQQNPKHPGVSHFLIHAFDYPPLAEKGIPAARRYASIAPAVPHARHMPSHIYSMVGLWEESIASNARALEIQPDYRHASDFTVYAHLQLAQDGLAKAVMDKSLGTPDRGDRPVGGGNFTATAAMPARYMLERADWKGAAALPVTTTRYPMADSITRFTARAREKRGVVLGGSFGRADARDFGVDLLCQWLAGRGAQVHAGRGRPRRRQRQAHPDGEPVVPDARTARRHAAGNEAAGTRAAGIRIGTA